MFEWENIKVFLMPFLKMLLIIVLGHIVISVILRIARKALGKSKVDVSLQGFILKATNIIMHIFIILEALSTVGVHTTGILATLSAAAVGVAVALKDSLSNVAGGILLLFCPRFQTGDYIIAGGSEGVVIAVDLMHTTIKTVDNKRVSIPNGVLINSHIVNCSAEEKRRVDITFSVSYECDIEKAKEAIKETILNHPLTLNEPEEPMVRVISYGDSAVNIVTRTWCKSENYWALYFDLQENVRTALERENISIPYNKIDVNIVK